MSLIGVRGTKSEKQEKHEKVIMKTNDTIQCLQDYIISYKFQLGRLDYCHINCYSAYALEMQINKTLKSDQS